MEEGQAEQHLDAILGEQRMRIFGAKCFMYIIQVLNWKSEFSRWSEYSGKSLSLRAIHNSKNEFSRPGIEPTTSESDLCIAIH